MRRVSKEFNEEADLIIFQGQERGIESVRHFDGTTRKTRFTRFSRPVVFLATVKDPFTTRGMRYEAGSPAGSDPKRYDMILVFQKPSEPGEAAQDGAQQKATQLEARLLGLQTQMEEMVGEKYNAEKTRELQKKISDLETRLKRLGKEEDHGPPVADGGRRRLQEEMFFLRTVAQFP